MTIRSKHNDLLNYFVHDKRDLSPAYVKKCERFLWSLRNAGLITKPQANTLFKMQAASSKRQASSKKGLDRAWIYDYIGDNLSPGLIHPIRTSGIVYKGPHCVRPGVKKLWKQHKAEILQCIWRTCSKIQKILRSTKKDLKENYLVINYIMKDIN